MWLSLLFIAMSKNKYHPPKSIIYKHSYETELHKYTCSSENLINDSSQEFWFVFPSRWW